MKEDRVYSTSSVDLEPIFSGIANGRGKKEEEKSGFALSIGLSKPSLIVRIPFPLSLSLSPRTFPSLFPCSAIPIFFFFYTR